MNRKREGVLLSLAFVLSVAADQWFKHWITEHIPLGAGQGSGNLPLIPGVLHLTHVHNDGAAFSMLRGGRWLFLALLACFCALVVWALVTDQLPTAFLRWMAVLAAGGAVGNGIDRALYGYVVDMFETEFIRFAVFNIADIIMCVCAGLFVIYLLFHRELLADAPGEETK